MRRLSPKLALNVIHVFFCVIRVFSMRKANFLPFCEETDCSISAPNIATEKDMTAGIIFGDGECRSVGGKVTRA